MTHTLLTLMVIFCWALPSLHASSQKAKTKDSLLHIYLASPADTTRLEALHKLALLDQQSPTFIYYENKLLEEAIAQKNLSYQSAALYRHVVYYYNKLDQKRAEIWLKKLEQFAEETKIYDHYFKGKNILVEFYIIDQKMELAIKEAQDLYEKAEKINHRSGMRDACLSLTTGYFNTMRYQEGLAALNNAFALTEPGESSIDKTNLLCKAILAYSYLHDNKNLLKMLEQLKSAIKTQLLTEPSPTTDGYSNLLLLMEVHYSLYYTRNKEASKSWKSLQKAEKYQTPSIFKPYQLILLSAYAEYYQLTKEYEKALSYQHEAITFIKDLSPEDMNTYKLQKAALLVEMGREEEALPLYQQITRAKDSLDTAFSSSQIEQILSLYNMDKLVLEKEKRQTMFHGICLSLCTTIILALILFNLHMYRSRRRLEKDEEEMRRLANIAEEAHEVKSRFLANMSYNIRIPLNNVVGFSQLLSTDAELQEKERKEYSNIIQSNSNELIQMVNDVLDLSRLEANMMKFQMQEYSVEEWCGELRYAVQMHGEGSINLQISTQIENAFFHADISRLTQTALNMLLYPDPCQEVREVKVTLQHHPKENILTCQIENSPITDPRFASQKTAIRQKINLLFFEYFGGSYEVENTAGDKAGIITFTYPTFIHQQQAI